MQFNANSGVMNTHTSQSRDRSGKHDSALEALFKSCARNETPDVNKVKRAAEDTGMSIPDVNAWLRTRLQDERGIVKVRLFVVPFARLAHVATQWLEVHPNPNHNPISCLSLQQLQSFSESFWRLVLYTVAFVVNVSLTVDKPWARDVRLCWVDM
jgi:hypothetical protein